MRPHSLTALGSAHSPLGPVAPPALPVLSLSFPQSPAKEGQATEKHVWQQHPRGTSCTPPPASAAVPSCGVSGGGERTQAAPGTGGASWQFREAQLEAHLPKPCPHFPAAEGRARGQEAEGAGASGTRCWQAHLAVTAGLWVPRSLSFWLTASTSPLVGPLPVPRGSHIPCSFACAPSPGPSSLSPPAPPSPFLCSFSLPVLLFLEPLPCTGSERAGAQGHQDDGSFYPWGSPRAAEEADTREPSDLWGVWVPRAGAVCPGLCPGSGPREGGQV